MEKVTLLDTSIGSTNLGDEIIMRCCKEELQDILKSYYCLSMPTHLSSFSWSECVGSMPDSASEISSSKYKFVCGTNLLTGNMFHRTNQWDINLFNCRPIKGCVLVGVGGSGTMNHYTRFLYKRVLSHEYCHSVRDKSAYQLISNLGLKCCYTGCITMWKLTEDFCSQIPQHKSDSVVFTLTDYKKSPEADRKIVELLKANYANQYFWIQGVHDYEYLSGITDTSNIKIIGPSVDSYQKLIRNGNIDYVGTRLHAGIFAMRNKIRSIILRVDARMDEMAQCIPNNTISREDSALLKDMIFSNIRTKCVLDWNEIYSWKKQFQ